MYLKSAFLLLSFTLLLTSCNQKPDRTTVTIKGEKFYINDEITMKGQSLDGVMLEGLLPNSRMVQGIFDDLNPETQDLWKYPDTGEWDADRNTREFTEAMPAWRAHGLLAFTINLQGGSPQGYSKTQPWHNSAIEADGSLREDYMLRLEKILDKADELKMVVILGIFYFGQDERIRDEEAVIAAVNNTVEWLFDKEYKNVIIEINNECNVRYDHEILKPQRVHELIELVKSKEKNGYRFYVGTSYGGNKIPEPNVAKSSDFILVHGNGVKDPARITEMVELTRQVEGYTPKPIIFNEDDHFDFDKPDNNMLRAFKAYASWGYFDFRERGKTLEGNMESFHEGFQSVPVDWGINSQRKKDFFGLVAKISGISL